jgi:hypothetical protein
VHSVFVTSQLVYHELDCKASRKSNLPIPRCYAEMFLRFLRRRKGKSAIPPDEGRGLAAARSVLSRDPPAARFLI